MKNKRIFTHIFPINLVIIVLSIIIISWIFSDVITTIYTESIKDKLKTNAYSIRPLMLSYLKKNDRSSLVSHIKEIASKTNLRITVIAPSGNVIAESAMNEELLENKADSPEVKEALNGISSFSNRYSVTLKKDTFYFALPIVYNGKIHAILRTALPMDNIRRVLKNAYIHISVVGIAVAVIAALFAYFSAKSLSNPLEKLKNNAGEFSAGSEDFTPVVSNIVEINELSSSLMLMSTSLKARINEIREEKNKLNIILANMREGVIAVDSDDSIITINASARKILNTNVKVAEESVDEKSSFFGSSQNSDMQKYCCFKSAMKIQAIKDFAEELSASSQPLAKRIQLPGIIRKDVEIHGALLKNNKQQIVGFLLVINDITKLKELQAMRKNFVANVSHELKTPLTAIKGAVETLIDGAKDSPENADKFLKIIKKHCDRLSNLINDTMSLSRIEQESEEEIVKERLRLIDIINVALDICMEQAEQKNITFNVNCSELHEIEGNAQMLEQVMVNLVDNALKFSPENDEILIKVKSNSHFKLISITDHGQGIAQKHIPHLFERFYRVDKGRSRRDGGTGLGLAIVKHIVKFHNGSVTVESTPGEYTTFTITIPAFSFTA